MWSYRRRHEAEAEARSAWLDAAALLEARSRIDHKNVADAHESLIGSLSDLRADMAKRDDKLDATLTQLGTVCESLAERMDADRVERREFVATINALAAALVGRGVDDHVVGGSVFGAGADEIDAGATAPPTIDLTAVEVSAAARGSGVTQASDAPPPGAEVRCRFGDRWVDGFEVLEVHSREGRARYRVRRRSDGSVVRKLFEANDLEMVAPRYAATD